MSFSDWWTNSNNPKLSKSEYMWSFKHILMIAIAISITVLLSIIFYKKSEKAKNILLKVLASILLFFEILSRIVNLIILDVYSFQNIFKIIMPLHICSVAVWVLIIGIFTKKQILLNFTSIVAILATVAFLLQPAVGINRVYLSFTCLYSVTSHILGFVVSVLLITLKFAKFEFKKIYQIFLCFTVMFLWGVIVDFVILPGNTENYMYLMSDPLELNLSFPYHLLYIVILSAYISIYYLVYYLVNKKKLKLQANGKK